MPTTLTAPAVAATDIDERAAERRRARQRTLESTPFIAANYPAGADDVSEAIAPRPVDLLDDGWAVRLLDGNAGLFDCDRRRRS